MYHPYLFQILMQEREREILEEIKRPIRYTRGHRDDSNLSKNIAYRLYPALIKLKAIARPRHARQRVAEVKSLEGIAASSDLGNDL